MRRGTIAADCAHGFAHVTFCPNRGYGWTGVQTGSGPHRNACEKCAKLQHHPPRQKERTGDRPRCQAHGYNGPPFKAPRPAIHRLRPPMAARRRSTCAASKDRSPARGGNLSPPKPGSLLSWCRQVGIASPRERMRQHMRWKDCPHARCAPPFHGSAAAASVGRYGEFFGYHERHMPFVQACGRRRWESPLPFVCERTPSSQRNHALRGTTVTASVEKTLCRDDGRGAVADVERAEDPE
jgi:hypothetical protein